MKILVGAMLLLQIVLISLGANKIYDNINPTFWWIIVIINLVFGILNIYTLSRRG